MNKRAVIGGNLPPDPLDEAIAPFADDIAEAENWLDGKRVDDEKQMKAVDAILREIKSAEKAVKLAEESEAKPIYDQWKAAKARYAPTIDDLGRIKKGLAALVGNFKTELARKKEEARREMERQARIAAEEAAKAAREADVADIEAQRAAQAKAEEADMARKAASAAAKDKVTGLRTVHKHQIDDYRAALHWIAQNDKPAMTQFIEEYVRKNCRDKSIDGVKTWKEKEAF